MNQELVSNPVRTGATATRHVPGESGVWVFIMGDMLLFALMFYIFVFHRSHNLALFRQSQEAMNPAYGALFTVLLLTSSWLVVMAVHAARRGLTSLALRLLTLATLCGAAFVFVKFFEYRGKVLSGITPLSNEFFGFYFVYTGLHLIHVLIGLGVLGFMRGRIRALSSTPPDRVDLILIEGGACYWHMVDLLWVVLFALLYMRG